MIVVADTSPLNYLIQIGEVDLLYELFGSVLIPQAVYRELRHPKTNPKVHEWIMKLPAWVQVRAVESVSDSALLGLDIGEREAIQLALALRIRTVLMDEVDGRREAERLHLEVRGTLGILERAARLGKIDFLVALSKLERTNFRISASVREAFLRRNP